MLRAGCFVAKKWIQLKLGGKAWNARLTVTRVTCAASRATLQSALAPSPALAEGKSTAVEGADVTFFLSAEKVLSRPLTERTG